MMELSSPKKRLRIGAVVCDLDRTLTDERLQVVPEALQAMREVRERGVYTILATGRTEAELRERPEILEAFDGVVAEGGGLNGPSGRLAPTRTVDGELSALAQWLNHQGVAVREGRTCLSIAREQLGHLEAYAGLDKFWFRPNRDRVDVTPVGIDKSSGLSALLGKTERARQGGLLAFADGENDLGLFETSDYSVAVANAVPELREHADEVTKEPGGHGVARFLRERLLRDSP